MENIVEKFKLKRREGTPNFRFSYGEYDVYRNLSTSNLDYAYYVLADDGDEYYFNMLDGEINNSNGHLEATNWEVIRINENKMNQFNVGEIYLCVRSNGVFNEGELYKVYDDYTSAEPYLITAGGITWFKSDLDGIYTEQFVKLNDEQKVTIQANRLENTKVKIDAEKLLAYIIKNDLDGSQLSNYLTGYIQASKGEF